MRIKYFTGTYCFDELLSFLDRNVCLKTAEYKDLPCGYIQMGDKSILAS